MDVKKNFEANESILAHGQNVKELKLMVCQSPL